MPKEATNAAPTFSAMMEDIWKIWQGNSDSENPPDTTTEDLINEIFLAELVFEVLMHCFYILFGFIKHYWGTLKLIK